MTITREDRITGCLLGGALGDAIGSHFEGIEPQAVFSIPSKLRVSDDTQLTLATAESIIQYRVITPEAVASSLVRWFRERRISGIGSSTLKALTELDAGGHWAMAGATGERSAGNGAAMRIAPLAFFLDPDLAGHRQTIRDICRLTHRNDEAYIGALAVLRTLRWAADGDELSVDALSYLIHSLPDSNVRDRLIAIQDGSLSLEEYATRFGVSGYVVDSVPLAILAAIRGSDIMQSILAIVQCGGDTDTIASLFGQIIGAARGIDCLPLDVINRIDAATMVREVASRLSRTSLAT